MFLKCPKFMTTQINNKNFSFISSVKEFLSFFPLVNLPVKFLLISRKSWIYETVLMHIDHWHWYYDHSVSLSTLLPSGLFTSFSLLLLFFICRRWDQTNIFLLIKLIAVYRRFTKKICFSLSTIELFVEMVANDKFQFFFILFLI